MFLEKLKDFVKPTEELRNEFRGNVSPFHSSSREQTTKGESILLSSGKAWLLTEPGSVNNLELRHELVLKAPQPHEATVRIYAVGLRYGDLLQVGGIEPFESTWLDSLKGAARRLFGVAPEGEILGTEFVGEIVALGRDHAVGSLRQERSLAKVEQQTFLEPRDANRDFSLPASQFKHGDRVMGITKHGGFSTFINIDPRFLLRVPPGWTDEQAAAFPADTLSSYYALSRLAHVERGSVVLLHSAANNLQTAQILAQMDCWVLGTVDTPSKLKLVQLLHGDNSRFKVVLTENTAAEFKAKLDRFLEYVTSHCSVPIKKFDFVVDSRGTQDPLFRASYDYLVSCGAYILLGKEAICPPPELDLSLTVPNLLSCLRHPTKILSAANYYWSQRMPWRSLINASHLVASSKTIIGFHSQYFFEPDVEARLLGLLFAELNTLDLDPPYFGAAYDFKQLPEALRYLQSTNSVGKVVVRVVDPFQGPAVPIESKNTGQVVCRQQSVDEEWKVQQVQIRHFHENQFLAIFNRTTSSSLTLIPKAA